MRRNIKKFASLVRTSLPVSAPVFEFGSLQVPGQIGFADLRTIFAPMEYVGCDMQEGPGVDRILNLHQIALPSSSVGSVLCLDTLEHVEYPGKAMEEIHRILRPNGIAVISSVMNYPIHDYPHDYWRFTPEAFRSLLKPFAGVHVGYQGSASFPHTVIGVGIKGNSHIPQEYIERYEKWQKDDRKSVRQLVLKLTPPIVLPFISFIYRTVSKRSVN